MNIRPLRASSMIASAPTSTLGGAALASNFSSRPSVSAVGFQSGVAELAQGIGVEAGGAGEAGAADLAGVDDGAQALDQDRAHGARVYHITM